MNIAQEPSNSEYRLMQSRRIRKYNRHCIQVLSGDSGGELCPVMGVEVLNEQGLRSIVVSIHLTGSTPAAGLSYV
jgi:hypothetical protein